MTNKKSGSAHIIIITILSVALMGTLAFVYYQNFIQNNDKTTKTDSNSSTSESTNQSTSNTDQEDTTSPNAVVKELLDSYISYMNSSHTGTFSSDLLTDSFQTVVTNPNGEMRYSDSILLVQNMPSGFSVGATETNGDNSSVTVALNFSEKHYNIYKLVKTEGGWKVDGVSEQ